jgi:hypothetical protein
MFANGHRLIMDRALDALPHSALREHYGALLLGNLREDVYKVPLVRAFTLGKGLTHYYRPGSLWGAFPLVPSAPARTERLVARGVREWRDGRPRDGAFWLGRAVHLLSEMAAPVHAQRILHWRGDPFEMYIERNHRELRQLPLPDEPRAESPRQLVHDLAVYTQRFPCDRTRNLPGYVGWKLGLFRRPSDDEVLAQVRALVPMGAAYTVALYRLFLARAGAKEAA